jgi:hypothetical protein
MANVVALVNHATPVNSADHVPHRQVSGRHLAHVRKMTKVQRAFLGADLARGVIKLDHPTIKQVAALAGVSTSYVHAALVATPIERREIERGWRPLKVAAAKAPAPTLDAAWEAASPDAQREFVRSHSDSILDRV